MQGGGPVITSYSIHYTKLYDNRFGPASILHYQGFGERTALKLLNMRLWSELGGVTALTGTLCGGAGQASMELSVGQRVSHDP